MMIDGVVKKLFIGLACFILVSGSTVGIFFIRYSHKSIDVAKALKSIPKEDRDSLEWFFRHFRHSSSYVLFGNKPMAWEIVYDPCKSDVPLDYLENFLPRLDLHDMLVFKGWETWKKYQHLFPSSRFVFLENREDNRIHIHLINKEAFLKKVEEHIDYFAEVLGPDATPQKVLNDCLKANDLVEEALKGNCGLQGVLFGFGKHNSQLFWKRNQLEAAKESRKKLLLKVSSVEEEYESINSRLSSFDDSKADDFNPLRLGLVQCVADCEHPETQELKIEYRKQCKEIISKYKGKDFLEVTLMQICGN